jgi:pyrophosphatase PpaX
MIKAVFFDYDGTLVDTNNLIIQSYKYTYKKNLGIDMEEKDIVKNFGIPLLTILKQQAEDKFEELHSSYNYYYESKHNEMVKVFDGVYETLKGLHDIGIMTGIVSSKKKLWLERGIKFFQFEGLFDVVIGYEDTKKNKPNPEPIIRACEAIGIQPEEALMVGDSNFDIECGKKAGSKTCLVKYTILNMDKIQPKPDYEVDKMTAILTIV